MAIVFTVACSGPLQLANIQIGRSLNQDGSVASITTLFKPSETITFRCRPARVKV
jgi:hypothetical protein